MPKWRPAVTKEIYTGAMADYVAGMKVADIVKKWGVSKGYIYNKLARTGGTHRAKARNDANRNENRKPYEFKRKLIPYAGKDGS
jgi:uncharacterized protein YjcR